MVAKGSCSPVEFITTLLIYLKHYKKFLGQEALSAVLSMCRGAVLA